MTKDDGTPYKVFTPFWKKTEQLYISKITPKFIKVKSKAKKINIFKKSISIKEILPKKIGIKNLKNIGTHLNKKLKNIYKN